jgi:hypothetical protein
MKSPGDSARTLDLDIDCEFAIETDFLSLVDRAKGEGWADDEVANALLSLAQNHVLALRRQATIHRVQGSSVH